MNDIAAKYVDINRTPHGYEAVGCFLGFTVHAYGMNEAQAIGKAADQIREILRQHKATCIANIRARYPNFKLGKTA